MKDYVVRIMLPNEVYDAVWQLPGEPGTHENVEALLAEVAKVTGEPVEHVNVFVDFYGGYRHRYLDMFVNEEGAIVHMPVNVMASAMYANNWMTHEPNARREEIPMIYGPAVLFEEKVWR